MMGFLRNLLGRRRASASERRSRLLQKAAAEMKLRETQEGSIWRSGKGGAHHDR